MVHEPLYMLVLRWPGEPGLMVYKSALKEAVYEPSPDHVLACEVWGVMRQCFL